MTIWVLQQTLTPEEEPQIQERTHLVLPFGDLPDLSDITNPEQAKKMLKALYPDDPPESIARRFERFWHQYSDLHVEDILVVPLPASWEVALAEVTGFYHYQDGIHMIPVKWYPARIAYSKFRQHKEVIENSRPMFEITEKDTRTIIRDKLPHKHNRFGRWKWLLLVFFIMNLIGLWKAAIQRF